MRLVDISVCIIAKNAQEHIGECLHSVREFGEVVLIDNESTDETRQIAQRFSNVKIYSSEFLGFGKLKNLAISYATNEWILSLDSDEVLESSSLDVIVSLPYSLQNIYALKRKNHYDGEWIKACGWYPDFVWRLFCKNFTHFNENQVHESLVFPPKASKIKLDVHLCHYPIKSMSDIITKMNTYTTLSIHAHSSKKPSMSKAILRFFWVFFKDFFLRKGFLYGYKGFIIAYLNANGSFFKYAKLYEKIKKEQKSISKRIKSNDKT